MQVKGLTIRNGKRGRVYKFKMDLYRDGAYQRTVYKTLGPVDVITPEQAQAEAAKLAGMVRRGVDPTDDSRVDVPTMTVRQLMQHYATDLKERSKGERYAREVLKRSERHVPAWQDRPFVGITREDCRQAHKRITTKHGPRVADQVISAFGTAWKVALQTLDGEIPTNIPVVAVRRNGDNQADYSDFSYDVFNATVAKAGPVLKRALLLTLFSGLRCGNVIRMRREWVYPDRIIIPRAEIKVKDKRRGPFVVPLSAPMRKLMAEAIAYANLVAPDCPYVFPAKSRDGKRWQHLSTIRNAHALRYMHNTEGQNAGVPEMVLNMLHDHAIGENKMTNRYTNRTQIDFARLLEAQEAISGILEKRITGRANELGDCPAPASVAAFTPIVRVLSE